MFVVTEPAKTQPWCECVNRNCGYLSCPIFFFKHSAEFEGREENWGFFLLANSFFVIHFSSQTVDACSSVFLLNKVSHILPQLRESTVSSAPVWSLLLLMSNLLCVIQGHSGHLQYKNCCQQLGPTKRPPSVFDTAKTKLDDTFQCSIFS